eukprot:CAMPEP_0168293998 /NCGR_PEP_ID=MMETSP0142_2-20121227/8328_1 /TAXON_ID=44445 /ORGANISM="Pseudo-nitzschia australis, Strain 10249 10 AB" /LENGTH=656 /DNA_ID=CAMNT_0008242215 /DNA_START=285 /DNA_END=2256 /DNA_ORIENTATION=+
MTNHSNGTDDEEDIHDDLVVDDTNEDDVIVVCKVGDIPLHPSHNPPSSLSSPEAPPATATETATATARKKKDSSSPWLSTQPASQSSSDVAPPTTTARSTTAAATASSTTIRRIDSNSRQEQQTARQQQYQQPPIKKRKVSLSPTDSLARQHNQNRSRRVVRSGSCREDGLEVIELLADDDDDDDNASSSVSASAAAGAATTTGTRTRARSASKATRLSSAVSPKTDADAATHAAAAAAPAAKKRSSSRAATTASTKKAKKGKTTAIESSASVSSSASASASSSTATTKKRSSSKVATDAAAADAAASTKKNKKRKTTNIESSASVSSSSASASASAKTAAAAVATSSTTKATKVKTKATKVKVAQQEQEQPQPPPSKKTTTPKPKKKQKRTTFEDELLQTMFMACRPYSVKELIQVMTMGGGKKKKKKIAPVSEASVNFCLLSHIDKNWVIKKVFESKNKSRTKELYWANQDCKDPKLWARDCMQLPEPHTVREARLELATLQQRQKAIHREQEAVERTPSNAQLLVACQTAERELTELQAKLDATKGRIATAKEAGAAGTTSGKPGSRFGSNSNRAFAKKKQQQLLLQSTTPLQLKKRINAMRDEWRIRKRKCMDFVDQLADGMEKKVKDVVHKVLELETDEAENVVIPPKHVI